MDPPSRTPEGRPRRCSLCGHSIKIEPSDGTEDAPCPHCGHLLWFGSRGQSNRDTRAIGEIKRQIRVLVNEIVQLAEAGLTPPQFYRGFLPRVVAALAAHGGAIWTLDSQGELQQQFEINLQATQLGENEAAQLKHARALQHVVTNDAPFLVPPHSCLDDPESGNPTDYLLAIAPLKQAGKVVGIVEIFQRPEANPLTQKGHMRFLQQMCEVAASAPSGSQQPASGSQQPASGSVADEEEICTTRLDSYPSWSREEIYTTRRYPYPSWNEEDRTWVILGGCLLFFSLNNVAVAPLMQVVSQNDPAAFVVYLSMAVIGAQMALQAVWCVFAPYRLVVRIAGVAVMAIVLPTAWGLGVVVAMAMSHFGHVDWEILRTLLCLPLLAVAIQSPLWAAKCFLGWRIVVPWHYLDEMPNRTFGIRDLLIAMAVGAAVLSAAQLAVPSYSSAEEFLIPVAISAVVLALVSLATTIPVLLATMRARRIGWAIGTASAYGAALTYATIVGFVIVMQRDVWAFRLGLATMASGFFVCLTACMLLFRALGWRLQWGRRRECESEHSLGSPFSE